MEDNYFISRNIYKLGYICLFLISFSGHDAKVHRLNCLKSEFSCIARIPTSNDNIHVGNSQLYSIINIAL